MRKLTIDPAKIDVLFSALGLRLNKARCAENGRPPGKFRNTWPARIQSARPVERESVGATAWAFGKRVGQAGHRVMSVRIVDERNVDHHPVDGFRSGFLPVLTMFLSSILLAGCANDNVDDLVSYVAEIRETRKGRVEPLPPPIKEEGFHYQASDQRDPFMSPSGMQRLQKKKKNSGIHPDADRKREPLESFQLDTLRMVGSMQKAGRLMALVQSPDGVIHPVRKGNYLGHNHGKVVSLSRNRIELVEIVPDGLGGWMERSAQISLKE